jgi:hypothetical protein
MGTTSDFGWTCGSTVIDAGAGACCAWAIVPNSAHAMIARATLVNRSFIARS